MVIDHIGIVVASLDDGIRQWEELFDYRVASDIVLNHTQGVRVVFLAKAGSTTVKLVQPVDAGSSTAAFARRGGGLHHICFRCKDLNVEIRLLRSKGARLVVTPQPGEAFKNNDIAFLLTKNNLSIELIDTVEKTGWREPVSELQT